MSVPKMLKVCCAVLLAAFVCIEAAPHRSKEPSTDNDSERMSDSEVSHEAESKEISDESPEVLEADSEYQDKDSKIDTENNKSRDDLLRPLPLPETYGIPGVGNPDMIPLAQILAESVRYVQERSAPKHNSDLNNIIFPELKGK